MMEDLTKMTERLLKQSAEMTNGKSLIPKRKYITVDGIYFMWEEDKGLKKDIDLGIKEESEYQDIERRVEVKRCIYLDTIVSWSQSDEQGICDILTTLGTFSVYSEFDKLTEKITNAS